MKVFDGSEASLLIRGNAMIGASVFTDPGGIVKSGRNCDSALGLKESSATAQEFSKLFFFLTAWWWFFDCRNSEKINTCSLVHFTSTGLIAQ